MINRAFIESDIFVRDNAVLRGRFGDKITKSTMLTQSTNKIRRYVVDLDNEATYQVEIYGVDRLRVLACVRPRRGRG